MIRDLREEYLKTFAKNELINEIVEKNLTKDQLTDLKNDINREFIESSFAYFKDNLHPMELHYLNESVDKGKLQARVDFTRKLIRIGFDKRKALEMTNLKESQLKDHIIQRHINPQYDYLRRIGFEKGKTDENKNLEKKLKDIII